MKNHPVLAALVTVLFLFCFEKTCMAQGNLTPPGPPAATMKTLSQIEPRLPISVLPTNLTIGGSYYVTTNLTGTASNNGITVSTNDVTIDLNGFTLTGVSSALSGIITSGAISNLVVKNGTIKNWPVNGINSSTGNQNRVINVTVMGCQIGMLTGISDSIQNCSVTGSVLFGCSLNANNLIKNSILSNNGVHGIVTNPQDEILDCFISDNGVTGIFVNSPNCLIDGNNLVSNGSYGLEISSGYTGNIIVRNTASVNPTNYFTQPGNDIGPIGTAASSTSPWANISN